MQFKFHIFSQFNMCITERFVLVKVDHRSRYAKTSNLVKGSPRLDTKSYGLFPQSRSTRKLLEKYRRNFERSL